MTTQPMAAKRTAVSLPWLPLAGATRALLIRVAREPLAHFVVLGLALFVAGQIYAAHTNVYRIEVTRGRMAELERKYALQFGAPPDPQTLEALINDDVHDEILFRQGLALKLDQGDEIVRRRVVQKEQFLLQNNIAPAEPTDAQLSAYYNAHAAQYAAPARTTFSHIYFAVADGGDAAATARARTVLAKLSNSVTRGPELGDPFPDLYDFSAYEPEQVARLFGHTPFLDAVQTAPTGRWSGPFRSAYGWHLVYIDARVPAGQPPLAEVRDRVREDYLQDAQDQANKTAFNHVAARFTVVRDDLGQR